MNVLKPLNSWNHQIIEGKVNDVRSSLGEARKLLEKPLLEEETEPKEDFFRRLLNAKCDEDILEVAKELRKSLDENVRKIIDDTTE